MVEGAALFRVQHDLLFRLLGWLGLYKGSQIRMIAQNSDPDPLSAGVVLG